MDSNENSQSKETPDNNKEKYSPKKFTWEYFKLLIQIFWGGLFVLPLGYAIVFWLRFILGYKIHNLKEVRKTYKKLIKTKQPILICPNHLTMIDSMILIWAWGSMLWYQFNYGKLSWNVPAVENFKNTWFRSVITYLSKCIAVDRQGSKEHHESVLKKTIYLIKLGHVFTYFPEGGRSRTARIDTENIRYGVGKLVEDIPNIKVICVYMRGDGQEEYSEIPKKGESFSIMFRELYPKTQHKGLRAHRDLSTQIIQTLKQMEDEYFAGRQSGK